MKLYQIDGHGQGIPGSGLEAALVNPSQMQPDSFRTTSTETAKSKEIENVVPIDNPDQPVHHVRVNNSFLATRERNALRWLAARTPSAVTPDHLTLLGLFGAAVVMAGFAACRVSPWFVWLAFLGLFMNWLGDSLDGTLARYRKIERPDFGYFLDHSCDLISQTFIFVGLGLSPYFTLFSALLALSMYLLMTSFTYLKVLILKTHHLSYYGMGATELRLLLIAWPLFALWYGPSMIDARFMGARCIDITIFILSSLVFTAFMWKVWSDVRRFRPILDK
ncbi:CDP-alcohol phosphatidyltransferase family protein [Sphingomonas immobilis]|uniref:CDP-alcohol phosphatidyltransferase family protein n=1 Tax=Sphingomonas immobilis TaxID=3063997 RepID=UPI00272B79A1|nr:CDP-alcohol phosphatidyltransferase family protein [Sphingomonas sp. CA1-15]